MPCSKYQKQQFFEKFVGKHLQFKGKPWNLNFCSMQYNMYVFIMIIMNLILYVKVIMACVSIPLATLKLLKYRLNVIYFICVGQLL